MSGNTPIFINTDDLESYLDGRGSAIVRVRGEVTVGKPQLSVEIETTKAGAPFYLDTKSAIESVADSMDGWNARDFGFSRDGPDLCARYSKRSHCSKPTSTSFESCLCPSQSCTALFYKVCF